MDVIFIILGVLQIIVCSMIFIFKEKHKMILCLIFYNILLLFQYLFQNYITETIVILVDLIRCITFFIFAYKNLKPNKLVILLFEIATVTCCIVTWQNWFSIFIALASMITTFSYWQQNLTVIRILGLISSVLIITNYIFTGLYMAIIAEAIIFTSALISLVLYSKKNKKNKAKEQSVVNITTQ